MNVSAIIDAIIAEGGFDTTTTSVTRATLLGFVNARYQEAVTEAGWLKAGVTLAVTVAGQAAYPIPANANDVAMLRVNGGVPWKRVTNEDLWLLSSVSGTDLTGVPGAFAPTYSEDGEAQISLFPTPDTDGYVVEALVSQTPVLLTDAAVAPSLPEQLQRPLLVDGGIAEGRTKLDERPDLAASYEASYAEAKRKLKQLTGSRVGSGAWQAKVAGVS